MASPAVRGLFGLGPQEQAFCFLNFGHIRDSREERARPSVDRYFSRLELPPQSSQGKSVKNHRN